jgi:hypothetical protein
VRTRALIATLGFAFLVAGCAVSTVNNDLTKAKNACNTAAPADSKAATDAAPNNAAVAKVVTVVNGACAAVNDAANNQGVVDSVVSFFDGLFGVNPGTLSAAPATASAN